MMIYLIYQKVNQGYDTFDSAVVAANSWEEAKATHPKPGYILEDDPEDVHYGHDYLRWCRVEDVQVQLIGTALPNTKAGVILNSFNAG